MKEKIKNFFYEESTKIGKVDAIVMIVIMLVYGIFSFIKLGTTNTPQTYSDSGKYDDIIRLKIEDGPEFVTNMRIYCGRVLGSYEVYTSIDGESFDKATDLKLGQVFSWQDVNILRDAKYIELRPIWDTTVAEYNRDVELELPLGRNEYNRNSDIWLSLGEIALYDFDNKITTVVADNDLAKNVLDEPGTVPDEINYMNSAYFDEAYYSRATYELTHGIQVYEITHPPMGKLIQTIPVLLFGFNPFTWRIAGNLCGIIMLSIIYMIAKKLFKKRIYAILAMLFYAFDNFRFTQTRMGTVDSELALFSLTSILFMLKYVQMKKDTSLSKRLLNLLLSGIFLGLTITTKFNGWTTGLVLAIMFFYNLIENNFMHKNKWTKDTTITVVMCFCFFIAIPIAIYLLSYILFPNTGYTSNIYDQTKYMFDYHKNLTEYHPYSSKWYTWPITYKPVWLSYTAIGSDTVRTISGLGNPILWWLSAISIIFIVFFYRKRDKVAYFLMMSVIATWLPYAFIGRVMFLYHYFITLPFAILSLVFVLKLISEKLKKYKLIPLIACTILVISSFIVFYPVSSGTEVSKDYLRKIKILPEWAFMIDEE